MLLWLSSTIQTADFIIKLEPESHTKKCVLDWLKKNLTRMVKNKAETMDKNIAAPAPRPWTRAPTAPAPRPWTRAPTAWIGKSRSYDKFPPFGWVLSVSPSLPNPFCHTRAAQLDDLGYLIRWFRIQVCARVKNVHFIGCSFVACFYLFKVFACIT